MKWTFDDTAFFVRAFTGAVIGLNVWFAVNDPSSPWPFVWVGMLSALIFTIGSGRNT